MVSFRALIASEAAERPHSNRGRKGADRNDTRRAAGSTAGNKPSAGEESRLDARPTGAEDDSTAKREPPTSETFKLNVSGRTDPLTPVTLTPVTFEFMVGGEVQTLTPETFKLLIGVITNRVSDVLGNWEGMKMLRDLHGFEHIKDWHDAFGFAKEHIDAFSLSCEAVASPADLSRRAPLQSRRARTRPAVPVRRRRKQPARPPRSAPYASSSDVR